MYQLPETLKELMVAFEQLPSIGPKTAERLALHCLNSSPSTSLKLAGALASLHEKVQRCRCCGFLSEQESCSICQDEQRESQLLCVVQEIQDVLALERTREFRGRYHVLGGLLSPLHGVGPQEIFLERLWERLAEGTISEIILALPPSVEGDATALYIRENLQQKELRISRLALGLPMGAQLHYTDEVTLGRAFIGRTNFV